MNNVCSSSSSSSLSSRLVSSRNEIKLPSEYQRTIQASNQKFMEEGRRKERRGGERIEIVLEFKFCGLWFVAMGTFSTTHVIATAREIARQYVGMYRTKILGGDFSQSRLGWCGTII